MFLDEVHRFTRAQQDVLLPFVEEGLLVFVGATTENPFFSLTGPLLSRSTLFRLEPLAEADLNQLVEEISNSARSRWSQQLTARGIVGEVRAEIAPVPVVSGDMAELRQVLTSMALNALDAMPEGGNLTFRTGREAGRVFCQVVDTGIGMSPEVQARVFEKFFRAPEAQAVEAHGLGLGLALVRQLVVALGGRITVDSAPGQGSTFLVALPVSEPRAGGDERRPPDGSSGKRRHDGGQ